MKLTLALLAALAGALLASDKWFPVSHKIQFTGVWGKWGKEQVCPGIYANRFLVQTEPAIRGDDTALNSVCIYCKDSHIYCSKKGTWGSWYYSGVCEGGFTTANYRFENPIDGDDTAGNTLELLCSTNYQYYRAIGAPDNWGKWSDGHCPHGTRICGIQTRVEDPIDGDDTALNGIRFTCCATVKKVEAYLKSIYHGEGGSGHKSYVMIKRVVSTGVSSSSTISSTTKLDIAVHVGGSVSYGAVTGQASVDVGYLREKFKSTINTWSQNITETKEFTIYLKHPTYLYQARSTIYMSDGSTVEQGMIVFRM